MNGEAVDKIVNGNYKNLGKVIDETVVANNAWVYSDWFKGYIWARYLVCVLGVDQTYNLTLFRKTPEGVEDIGESLISSGTARATSFGHLVDGPTTGGLVGPEFKLGIQNIGGSDTSRIELYARLHS